MAKITKQQYEFALARIEELLPMVDDNAPANDRNAVELTMMSDVVMGAEGSGTFAPRLAVGAHLETIPIILDSGHYWTVEL